jgi:CheY-like chemotaxis protein/DNA-directed RNA polymerase specialized sigma24 family protein
MSMTQSVAPHLPYLRRYARALAGSQTSGDSYVRATLSALMDGEQAVAADVSPRVGLYQVFHAIWSSASGHVDDDMQPDPRSKNLSTPDARLARLDAQKRAALLLTAVEAFSLDEAAFIVDETMEDIERAILEAQNLIDRELASRVLIIEDEPIIALDLETLVTEMGHTVVGIAATRDEAVAKAKTGRPGIVLADVNLGDGSSGIEAVAKILESFDIPVIFITAYPEKLLTGERPEPTYLVAKPFLPASIQATVGQALFFHTAAKEPA